MISVLLHVDSSEKDNLVSFWTCMNNLDELLSTMLSKSLSACTRAASFHKKYSFPSIYLSADEFYGFISGERNGFGVTGWPMCRPAPRSTCLAFAHDISDISVKKVGTFIDLIRSMALSQLP
ncbi:hypothetical protein MUK42_28646 [Musa troglodytarum]|uniref:Uncharacterized protein n=1 Tax=Musa troglodytarum TaxID=320322 RepID=A0A9E7GFQ9_9LILI|nr:hypothetical protein MUK42_28646 [Musa troglodytarum]